MILGIQERNHVIAETPVNKRSSSPVPAVTLQHNRFPTVKPRGGITLSNNRSGENPHSMYRKTYPIREFMHTGNSRPGNILIPDLRGATLNQSSPFSTFQ
ncbi:MAG: hypothetical protein ACLTZT_18515 [Butyricimonas faecalis]